MPIIEHSNGVGDDEETVRARLLEAIQSEETSVAIDAFSQDWARDLEEEFQQRGEILRQTRHKEYESLCNRTTDIKLCHVLHLNPEGRSLFEDLCLRLDINADYAEILPGWKDLAGVLQIEDLKTRWVEVCVRPREGLTRAILEIYTMDGGSLGDVLSALLQMECLQIFEALKPKIYTFLEAHNLAKGSSDPTPCFSIIKGLSRVLPPEDPCHIFQQFSNGLKNYKLCQDTPEKIECEKLFTSDLNESSRPVSSSYSRKWSKQKDNGNNKRCNILLLFASDGIAHGARVRDLLQGFEHNGVHIEIFRLNEVTLWYELLNNPEACCMKWANEADYIVPILTPTLLQNFHGSQNEEPDSLVPTSPILNHYLYTLARARYTEHGCRNTMVRPIIPLEYLKQIGQSQVVRRDPILRLVWIPLKEERVLARAKGMLTEYSKEV